MCHFGFASAVIAPYAGERTRRCGKNYRMDKFKKMFPDKKPEHVFSKMNEATGKMEEWVKVFDDDEGIEQFEAFSENAAEKGKRIDDGELVLDQNQADNS